MKLQQQTDLRSIILNEKLNRVLATRCGRDQQYDKADTNLNFI